MVVDLHALDGPLNNNANVVSIEDTNMVDETPTNKVITITSETSKARKIVITSTEWEDEVFSPLDQTKGDSFPKETLQKLRQPWKLTLTGKCLGILVRLSFITQRVRAMWRPKGSLESLPVTLAEPLSMRLPFTPFPRPPPPSSQFPFNNCMTPAQIRESVQIPSTPSPLNPPTPLLWSSIKTPPTPAKIKLMYNALLQLAKVMVNQIAQPISQFIPTPPSPTQQTLLPRYQQQVAWPNYQIHDLVSPPLNPQIIPLLSENIEQDLKNLDHLMKIFKIKKGVLGLQIDANFWETINTIMELDSMVTPLKIHDIVMMDRQMSWSDWDKFDPLFCNGSSPPEFLYLDMKIFMWNVRDACRNEFIPHAWDVIVTHKPKASCLVDLGFSGNPFTWKNAREGLDLIQERLDRALGNSNWLNTCPNIQATVDKPCSSSNQALRLMWASAHKGYYELNTDGSWMSVDNAGGGGVIRCDKGLWIIGYTMKFNALTTASTVLLAIREGLLTAWSKNIKFLELETDADALIKMLKDPKLFEDSDLGNVMKDVASLLQRDWSVTIFHASREVNFVACGLPL
uniref:RNase H type-1 domain-containing protein n=1 Tax=Chenopodium quinoa TaxID=63459 RepID=A0A803N9G1_CHEQI